MHFSLSSFDLSLLVSRSFIRPILSRALPCLTLPCETAKTMRAPFPSDPEEFSSDSRISFSDTANAHILVDENGDDWEWLPHVSKWTRAMNQDLMAQQAEIYKMPGVDESVPAVNPAKKRKEAELEDPATNPKHAAKAEKSQPKNTAVFVTSLPDDTTVDEVFETFRRYGMIHESMETNAPRIKLYHDDDGNFKGEALIVYFRPESVALAVQVLDGTDFRPGKKMRVVPAQDAYKAHKDDSPTTHDRPKAKAKTKSYREREIAKKKAQEMNSRLADWDDDEPSTVTTTSSRWDKVVVIKRAFTLQSFQEDAGFVTDLEEDMREEAEAIGNVLNITIFDKEEEGVVTIRFDNPTAAQACARKFDGRNYDNRKLVAYIADGPERFKKTRKQDHDDDDEERERLDRLDQFVQTQNTESGSRGGDAPGAEGQV